MCPFCCVFHFYIFKISITKMLCCILVVLLFNITSYSSTHAPHSIKQIAEAPLEAVQSAIKDDKAARPLQNACKAALKRSSLSGPTKRPAPDTPASQPKRTTTDVFMTGPVELTPQQLEKSLELPLCMDEERIAETVVETNRAPLVLAFAVELLRYTMPEQPLSSRLSLGQAIVSANSRSKAVSLGLDKGPSADDEGWGEGQPRVKVMGREIAVLKRGGYEWKGDEEETAVTEAGSSSISSTLSSTQTAADSTQPFSPSPASTMPTWKASKPLTLKSSTFSKSTLLVHNSFQQSTNPPSLKSHTQPP